MGGAEGSIELEELVVELVLVRPIATGPGYIGCGRPEAARAGARRIADAATDGGKRMDMAAW